MQSWVQRVFLLLLFLLSFDASSFVFGAPQSLTPLVRRLSQRSINGETNAGRFSRGLPPLAPVRRASTTETARRSTTSDTVSFKGKIKVNSVVSHNTIGFLQLTGAHDRYVVGSASSADQFTATLFKQGITADADFLDSDAPAGHPFLAGLISPGAELLASNSNAAIVGNAPVQTAPGSTPQSGGSVSIPGSDYETAIWNYSPSPPTLIPSWVNFDGSQPVVSLVWDPVGQALYLTADPAAIILSHPGSQTVELSPI